MKSGLEGRNNRKPAGCTANPHGCLNEVRPRRPEQTSWATNRRPTSSGLNEVRPRRPEQSTCMDRLSAATCGLNEVRPRRPEQCRAARGEHRHHHVSMKSGLEGRNKWFPNVEGVTRDCCLNEVRPRRPEQRPDAMRILSARSCLNEVRPRRPEQDHVHCYCHRRH